MWRLVPPTLPAPRASLGQRLEHEWEEEAVVQRGSVLGSREIRVKLKKVGHMTNVIGWLWSHD